VTGKDGATPIRVMLVADQPVFISLMEALLVRQPDLEVVAQAGSLTEARRHAAEVSFDVAVLILSASLDPASLERATEAGADEIMDKFAPIEDILGMVRRLGSA
jgi:DNA-binding NarL/FixJ family response regulator